MAQKEVTTERPTAEKFVTSALRNRIKLELNAPVSAVWAIAGDPGRMPEYSGGLEKVDTKKDSSGNCSAYTCYFKPIEAGGQSIVHHVKMVWYEPNKGWASIDEEPNAFGLQQSLSLQTFEANDNKTILTWSMHFNSENEESLKANVSALEQALNKDIAQNLIKKFGGRIVESYVEGKN